MRCKIESYDLNIIQNKIPTDPVAHFEILEIMIFICQKKYFVFFINSLRKTNDEAQNMKSEICV